MTTTTHPHRARLTLAIDGMTSPDSAHTLESALSDLPSLTATADYPTQSLHLEFNRRDCALPEIAARLDKLGLRLRPTPRTPAALLPPDRMVASSAMRALVQIPRHPQLACAVVGGALLLGAVINNLVHGPPAVRYVLVGLSFVIAGYYTVIDAARVLLAFRFDIDVLMVAAAFGAAILGHFEEGAFLLFLFALGGAGEQLAMDRARNAIEALAKLAPDTATLRNPDGTDRTVRVEDLKAGDLVVVRPYDRLPADGSVHTGTTAIDQSPITGESVPVDKHPGDGVFAGTINGDVLILVTVTRHAADSTLSNIVRMVREAQATKSPTQQFTEKVEIYYVPFVLISTAVLIVVPPLFTHNWAIAFYRAMAYLTAASPCALAIGTPAAMLSGIARAARLGVLVKGGAHLESLARVSVIAFDKTGTLTRGRPSVTDIVPLGGIAEEQLLRLAAAVENASSHPLAAAIVAAAKARHLEIPESTGALQVPGKGITATVDGRTIMAGRPEMSAASPQLHETIHRLSAEGKSIVAISVDGVPAGVIALADRERHNAADTVARLKRVARTVMLTGDNPAVAARIAATLGLDEFHAGLMPDDKLTLVRDLQARYGPLAMVGDGVNDAPALAAATVGIAMGSAGTDVAIETADVALMGDDLQKLPDAIALSRFARTIIRQNLTIALGTISILAPLSALGYTYLGVAVLFHEGSTILVVLNSLRLLAFKPDAATIRR